MDQFCGSVSHINSIMCAFFIGKLIPDVKKITSQNKNSKF